MRVGGRNVGRKGEGGREEEWEGGREGREGARNGGREVDEGEARRKLGR